MSHKRKGQLTVSGEWAKHLRPWWRREFWKQERQAAKNLVRSEVPGPCNALEEAVESASVNQGLAGVKGSQGPVFLSATPVLASLDIQRSADFFETKLGFSKVYVAQGSYGIVNRGAVEIHFWACSDKSIAEATSCRVRVAGIRQLYERCLEAGIVHPNAHLQSKPWEALEFAVLDPDGNLVTFHEPQTDA